jgi:hypothetical protein
MGEAGTQSSQDKGKAHEMNHALDANIAILTEKAAKLLANIAIICDGTLPPDMAQATLNSVIQYITPNPTLSQMGIDPPHEARHPEP